MAKAILIGNGVNRLSGKTAWVDVLATLADSVGANDVLELAALKPFALVYEEIAFRSNATSRAEESALKKKIADLVGNLACNKYHRQLLDAADAHVITTNYDYNIERSSGSDGEPATLFSESRYSVFRRRRVGHRFVWHVHGEASEPDTILLGHDHYCGQLQKLRAYATANRSSKLRPRSPFKIGQLEYEQSGESYSWIDIFFRDEVHIIGLGLDYTEIDLWWLLAYKRRLAQLSQYQVGPTIYHQIIDDETSDSITARVSVLRSFGVQVITHNTGGDYAKAYDRILDLLA